MCGLGRQDSGLGQGGADSSLSFALPFFRDSASDPGPEPSIIKPSHFCFLFEAHSSLCHRHDYCSHFSDEETEA